MGPGPNSLKVLRTNYRREETAADIVGGVHLSLHLSAGE